MHHLRLGSIALHLPLLLLIALCLQFTSELLRFRSAVGLNPFVFRILPALQIAEFMDEVLNPLFLERRVFKTFDSMLSADGANEVFPTFEVLPVGLWGVDML